MIRIGHYYRNKLSKRLYMVEDYNQWGDVLFFGLGGIHAFSDTACRFLLEFEYYNP